MHRIGVSGGIYFACPVAETHVVLCFIMNFLFNRGIHCHQLILSIKIYGMTTGCSAHCWVLGHGTVPWKNSFLELS